MPSILKIVVFIQWFLPCTVRAGVTYANPWRYLPSQRLALVLVKPARRDTIQASKGKLGRNFVHAELARGEFSPRSLGRPPDDLAAKNNDHAEHNPCTQGSQTQREYRNDHGQVVRPCEPTVRASTPFCIENALLSQLTRALCCHRRDSIKVRLRLHMHASAGPERRRARCEQPALVEQMPSPRARMKRREFITLLAQADEVMIDLSLSK